MQTDVMLTCLTCPGYPLQEKTKSDAEKLIADMTNLVSNHIRRQNDLVCQCFSFPFSPYYF